MIYVQLREEKPMDFIDFAQNCKETGPEETLRHSIHRSSRDTRHLHYQEVAWVLSSFSFITIS